MRVLVTGSRTWTDLQPVHKSLHIVALAAFPDDDLTVVHGGAGRGADFIAAGWCAEHAGKGWPVQVERYPADWRKYGKRAGILRNLDMVRRGADLCLAFIRDNSRGATHCAQIAAEAGIETRVFTWREDGQYEAVP